MSVRSEVEAELNRREIYGHRSSITESLLTCYQIDRQIVNHQLIESLF
jgi:hypothetical protein